MFLVAMCFSVGSLGAKGSYAVVEQVHVYNCTFKGSDNGMRIKTWPVPYQDNLTKDNNRFMFILFS